LNTTASHFQTKGGSCSLLSTSAPRKTAFIVRAWFYVIFLLAIAKER